ncbi:MAG: M23 family metallopeptidase [bacterium]
MSREKVSLLEMFGLSDLEKAKKDAAKAIFGKGKIPPSKFDLSSMNVFKPRIAIPTWLGIKQGGRKAPIYNFYNRVVAPKDEAFSVRVTYARDFTGGQWTYDSHLGTDFAIPVGTRIVACAPGKVVWIARHLDHGGLKIFIDHGEGLITTYAHLSRALVEEGDVVGRGQSIALSGAAGLELILFFPWVAPHLHLNVILNGAPVDPFALPGEAPMWIGGNEPVPHTGAADSSFTPTAWNESLISAAIADCSDAEERGCLESIQDIEKRALETIDYRMFYSTLFRSFPTVYEKKYERRPILDLPFSADDYDGALLPR